MLRVLMMSLLVVAALGHISPPRPEGCNYYCKKPEGPNKGSNYCCGPEYIPLKREEKHAGNCPPPLKECTRFPRPPQVCPHDGHCPYNQKCCFDTCLDIHTCKPAHFYIN
uniref:Pl-crustin 2 n=1 Tax=Pacifastacus leniusculus TaxID=6720 RepID=A5A3L2_PACLE|nr:Pl-crustin 2 [Pacifastacus leniusculus]